ISFMIRRATYEDKSNWMQLRQRLWHEAPIEYLSFDMDDRLADQDYAVFVAAAEDGSLVAFIEVGLREYGEGCESSPVGYIEAWYVDEHMRGQKLGRDLVQLAEQWAREKGCRE